MSFEGMQRREHCMRYTRLGSVNRGRIVLILVLTLLISLFAPVTAFGAPAVSAPGTTDWVQVYTVQRGDTLSQIAWDFGVSEQALLQANSLHDPDEIYVGQQLIIPNQGGYGTGGPECASYYTVRPGDTLSQIALDQGVDEYALARANGVYDLNDIYVGQQLCIPGGNGSNNYPQQPSYPPDSSNNKPQQQNPNNSGSQQQNPNNSGPQGNNNEGPQQPNSGNPQGPNEYNDGPQGNNNQGPQQPNSGNAQGPNEYNNGPQHPDYDEPQHPNEEYDHEEYDHHDGQQHPDDYDHQGGPPQDGPDHPDQYGPPHDGDNHYPHPTEYWTGTYYNDKYFSEFVLERQDLEVNFNWLTGSPVSNMEQDRFSVHWEKVEYFKGGPFRFHAVADDGVRVYVDDQLIIDAWVIQPATEYKADINLSEGPHKLVVDYYEEAEDAQIHVYWEPLHHNK